MAHRIPPLTDVDVSDLVRSVRRRLGCSATAARPALDVAALEDMLARVSVLADDLPEVAELELYPVLVAQAGGAGARGDGPAGPAARPTRRDTAHPGERCERAPTPARAVPGCGA